MSNRTDNQKLPASTRFARAQSVLRDAQLAFHDAEQALLRAKAEYEEAWKAIVRASGLDVW